MAGMVCALGVGAFAQAQAWAYDDGTVPFVVTPAEIVERMMRMGEIKPGDYVIDLGSGDGRIVIEAARRGARGLGVDIDPRLVAEATRNAREAGVGDRVRFEARDLFDTDLSPASVVTMYLLPEVNMKLRPRLLALEPGTRIISHDWNLGDWLPDERLEMRTPEKTVGMGGLSLVKLWVVPADASGSWRSEIPGHGGEWRFAITQRHQMLEAQALVAGRELVVRGSRLRGREIKLVVTGLVGARPWHQVFDGVIEGDRISGEVTISDGNNKRTLPWNATRVR
jgi:methylase of polypeptide subunit release factors